jgi:four helix bundle protein
VSNSQKEAFIEQFKSRTKKFVVDNINLFRTLPKTEEAKIIGRQLLRSSSSVGANYRAACRARSKAEFHSNYLLLLKKPMNHCFGWKY